VPLIIGTMIALIAFLLRSAAAHDYISVWGTDVYVPRTVGYLAASLFIATAGLISTGLTIHGRARASSSAAEPSETLLDRADPSSRADAPSERRRSLRQRFHLPPEWLGGWPHVVTAVFFGVIALMTVIASWRNDDQGALPLQAQQVFGGVLILLAFPFLVLERIYANTARERLPEAPQLERLARVPLVAFLGFGIASVLLSLGLEWPSMIERATAALIGLVSLELMLRGAATMFLPDQPVGRRRSCADSTIASLLRPTPPTLATFGTAVKRQFGIDLSRSWALAFVRRAALPIGLGMGVVAWCLTGVTALRLSERAVYERFGAPVAILGPGLHFHLPWPFGVLRPLELGVVHEMPIIFAPAGEAAHGNPVEPITRVEDVPPASADRLWDTSHPGEASYLIASQSQGKQSFQIVNIDLRVVYRIGLSDAAAKQAAYAVADPEALIRAIAGQLLVRYFARYTLLDVLVQSRERFATDFRNELQSELQKLSTGIDVIAVIVEAIHPPPGAANAYHNVQAAEILAHSEIALRQAEAIKEMKRAQQSATEDHNNAVAAASERVNQAYAESVLFEGDRRAYQQDGRAFLLERWLGHLSGALQKSGLVLIDHRLNGMTAPTVDLRSLDLAGATARFSPSSPGTAQPQGPQNPQGQQEGPQGHGEDEDDRD
jgi:regulator of protease activity HflC (stomatin/prohibitin superfamily)